MELTQRVLNRLRGRLDITVCHPSYAGKLVVKGITNCAADYWFEGMPEEMKVDRVVYRCAAEQTFHRIFVFADEAIVVDAPADMVVDEMLDMMYEMGSHVAVERLENGEPDEVDEEEE